MRRTPLSLIAHWTGGDLHGEDVMVCAIGHDTRALDVGVLYVALRGQCFDAHAFCAEALARGAAGLLVDHLLPELDIPQVVVADTERALAAIAAALQRDRTSVVLALTGSNGKTSVKALLVSILEHAAAQNSTVVYANSGNRNNEIGLPLAVIAAPDDADFVVYEMGAGKLGDIGYLTGIVPPNVALVNNIAPAHLERMGSLLGVARTKGEIYTALRPGGTAVINADDAFAVWFEQQCVPAGRAVLRFGLQVPADITAYNLQFSEDGVCFVLVTPQGEVPVRLALPGRHNVRNALAAAAMALVTGISLTQIATGLGLARPVAGRQVAHALPGGAVLIDDSYNANPGSLDAAIDTLATTVGPAWLVLGDMRELGVEGIALHAAAGRRARQAKVARLYALGELSAVAAQAFGEGGHVVADHDALANVLW
ncbi:MAG TPA: UDP-N-acetylmuramoyl-tripeptide--D-alanyl-D-alanine ligase, partial [Xylella taiwanensis]